METAIKEVPQEKKIITMQEVMENSGISQICTDGDECGVKPGEPCHHRRCGRPFSGE